MMGWVLNKVEKNELDNNLVQSKVPITIARRISDALEQVVDVTVRSMLPFQKISVIRRNLLQISRDILILDLKVIHGSFTPTAASRIEVIISRAAIAITEPLGDTTNYPIFVQNLYWHFQENYGILSPNGLISKVITRKFLQQLAFSLTVEQDT